MIAFILTPPNIKPLKQATLPNETLLAEGLVSGSFDAFNQLYKMYAPSLLGVISKIVQQQETAEDLLQDTFIKIRKYASSYDPSKSRIFTWISRIARNTALDYLRLKMNKDGAKNISLDFVSAELDTNYTNSFNPEVIGLKNLFNSLNSKQREIIDLIYYKGYTHEEVAEKLSMPIGTVKTRIRMSIQKLRMSFN
ncbi:RNA polymerase sigma factor [Pedobacter fastidiosus]|uniref:Sigma-70 family RNA polymerase sigma factor n=1 Tax=Pedobacter fastidiosus TaxID=2765361 RepID=A0ABR7KQL5_9SPHI|nr:sigma-70 family RNA polymerase sigma factor [Pedobacter fastidiosus]MBC6110293.1 sigma-70 family RNA polymerase sigma factor [Pedobacter fastidiosus]